MVKKVLIFILAFVISFSIAIFIHNKYLNTQKVSVYFIETLDGNKTQLVEVTRNVPVKGVMKNALSELFKGPNKKEKEQGYYSEIPVKSKFISIKLNGDKIHIDLSKSFENGGGSETMSKRVNQVVKTLRGLEKDKEIEFSLEGEKVDYIGGEGVEVPEKQEVKSGL